MSSPFLLGGVLECHLNAWEERYPKLGTELRHSLHVDDLLTGDQTIQEGQKRKKKATEILGDATFKLHKWHSNIEQLERDGEQLESHDDQSFAKQPLGVRPNETRMLGLKWNKRER